MNPDMAEEQWTLEQVRGWRLAIHVFVASTCVAHLSVWSARSFAEAVPVPLLAGGAAWALLKKGEIDLYNGRSLWSTVRHRRFFVVEALTTLPWGAINLFIIACYAHFAGTLTPVVGSVLGLAGSTMEVMLAPLYRVLWRLPAGDGAFKRALPGVCEKITDTDAGFWGENLNVCLELYHAYERRFLANVEKSLAFGTIFFVCCFSFGKYIIATLFEGVKSFWPHVVVYGSIAMGVMVLYRSAPQNVLPRDGRDGWGWTY